MIIDFIGACTLFSTVPYYDQSDRRNNINIYTNNSFYVNLKCAGTVKSWYSNILLPPTYHAVERLLLYRKIIVQ